MPEALDGTIVRGKCKQRSPSVEEMSPLQGSSTTKDMTKVEINIDSKIRGLAFLPGEASESRIVSCEENMVQLRHLNNNLMGEPIESSTGILTVASSKDGHWIVTGATDGFAIWNMGGKVPVKVVHHAIGGVRTIDISSDSKWVITGSDARTVDVWDLSTGERRPDLGPLKHEYNVVGVKFCHCGQRIATVTLFGSIRIYATSSGKKLLTIPVSVMSNLSSSNITLAWFANPSRPQLFAVSQGQIKCLDPNDGSVIFQWPLRGVSHPASIALSPSNKVIAYSSNATVTLRDIATGQQIGDTLKLGGNVSCIAFSPGSDRLVVGADTKFTIWDLRKLLPDPSYFVDTTMEYAESCAHHKQDTVQKPPPSTYSLPLMSISNGAVKPWLHGYLDSVEEVLSKEIGHSPSVPNHDTFANRALIRGRLGDGSMALEDAEKSLLIQISAIGQIAKTIAIIQQGNHELARQEIPKVLGTGHSEKYTFLLKVIQSILSCLSGEYDREISHINKLSGDQKLLLLVQANMHLSEQQFGAAMQSFKKARVPTLFPYDETQEMWTISFIFGWKFSGLGIQIQQRKCEFLLNVGNPEAADLFLEVKDIYQREIATHAELSSWALAFGRECLKKLEDLGDKALTSGDYNEAIKQYKAVEPLVDAPELKHALLLKRSEAHAEIGQENWEQALRDANEAIRLDPSSPWGYDRKHAVLYKYQDYREAAEALDQVIILLKSSKDAKSTQLRDQGVRPEERRKTVLEVVEYTLAQPRPHMLINAKSGRLCDKQKQTEAFRGDLEYKDLVLSPASPVGADVVWKEVIQNYFRYSTLSHTWEDKGEPEFRDVEKISVNNLTASFPNTKLQMFCTKTREHGYLWAWSDTCCINKADREVLNVSLRSMYRWYSESSLTIVHLRGVLHQLEVDFNTLLHILDELLKDFVECRWNQRAWTLQEYFASKAIHFYTEDWKPYLPIQAKHSDTNLTNHKSLLAIQRGMELVTGLDAARLAALRPGSDEARQKLRLASTRQSTRREDVAYSLLGIFKVTIEAIYGDDEVPRALGRLLGALLTQSADVTILAWTGQPSEYNSCLPAEITVYQEPESLHVPDSVEEAQLAALASSMLSSLSPTDLRSAIKLHDRLLDLSPPELHHGRLKLPCIWFPLPSITEGLNSHSYTATVPFLGDVELKTTEELSSSRNMVLVHPWFRRLLDPGISLSDSARRESASRLLAALRQPFGALLLAWNHSSRDYQRIAPDQLIRVQIREDVSPEQLLENIRVLYIR